MFIDRTRIMSRTPLGVPCLWTRYERSVHRQSITRPTEIVTPLGIRSMNCDKRIEAINMALLTECGNSSGRAGYKHRTPDGVRDSMGPAAINIA